MTEAETEKLKAENETLRTALINICDMQVTRFQELRFIRKVRQLANKTSESFDNAKVEAAWDASWFGIEDTSLEDK